MARINNQGKLCAAKGCDKPARRRLLCNTHYARWLRYGDINKVSQTPVRKKGVLHPRAKGYSVVSPAGRKYLVHNLVHFVRTHESLFAEEDVRWKLDANTGRDWCRASAGLHNAMRKGQWKGWRVIALKGPKKRRLAGQL